jgi:putative MATE family efflux protein
MTEKGAIPLEEKTSIINNMTEGPLLRQLVRFSIPIIMGNILQACYTLADMVVVGHFIGADGISAVGIGGILQNLLLTVAMGLGFGGQILLSQQVGAKAHERIKKTIGSFMTIAILGAVLFGCLGLTLNEWLLERLNTPAEVYAQTRSYYLVCCAGIVFIYGYNCICSILRGLGESKLPTVFIAIATVLNIALDCILIGLWGMDVEGAAIATVAAQGVAFLASLVYLIRHKTSFGFDFRLQSFRISKRTAEVILKLSLPIIIYGLLMSISGMFINANVNEYGVAASAVDGIGNKLITIVNALAMGFYTGGGAIIGQCFGAGKTQRIRKTFFLTTGLGLVVWAVLAVVLVTFSAAVFRIFSADPEVLAMARPYMLIATLMCLGMTLSTGPFALFEGVGNTTLEMIAGIVENLIVKIVASMLLSRLFGLYGYWMGCAAATFATPVVGFAYYFSGRWAKRSADICS